MRQRLARIAQKRRLCILEQPERDHRAGARGPVDRQRAAPRGAADAVRVAAGKDHVVAHDILAPHIHAHDGKRHADAVLRHPLGLVDGDALAPQNAVEVAHRGVQHLDLRIIRKPGDNVLVCDRFGTHACATPFLCDMTSA